MSKELTERKKIILHGLVDLYISTGQPVSSSDIQNKFLPNVSSATIRSELNALEAMGYIEQPHTSAGRIPLKDAYKFYVDSINSDNSNRSSMLTDQETAMIRNKFLTNLIQVEDISKEAAKIISDLTNYTSFFVEKSLANVIIDEIKLVKLSKSNKAIVLIVTDHGMISDKTIDIEGEVRPEFIDAASRVLNKVFAGKFINELELINVSELINDEMNEFKGILDDVLGIIKIYISEHQDKNVFVEGALKMLDYPEYNNVEDAKNFLSVISDKSTISELMVSEDSSIEFSVRIGKEDSGVDKCAIVTAAYKVGDEVVGQAGVIGPERMDYKKVIGVLDCMKKTLSTVIDNHDGDNNG
ncbi:MAG: heat-inducible transcriptional repressor HrcA [Clostridia bacterium]|nr:heat-inducible transcriptional repressor HrcA [Clostridia bacterium]